MSVRLLKCSAGAVVVVAVALVGFCIANPKPSETARHTVHTLPREVPAKMDNLNDRFWLFLPERYAKASKEKPMPLIIYLHGSSRRGKNIEEVKANGLAPLMDKKEDFEFVVVRKQMIQEQAQVIGLPAFLPAILRQRLR